MKRSGFTIVELIIVITVIGILATIAIVSYSGFTNRGYDSAVQTDIKNIADQFEIFRTKLSTTDEYPASTTDLDPLDIDATNKAYNTSIQANLFACVSTDKKSFAIVAQSKSGAIFMITNGNSKPVLFSPPASSFTFATTCSSLGIGLVSTGWYSNAWRDWAGGP